jgi:hypothetical protein
MELHDQAKKHQEVEVVKLFKLFCNGPYPSEEYGFGIWADRSDIPEESVEYVNKMREECDKKELSDIISEAETNLR